MKVNNVRHYRISLLIAVVLLVILVKNPSVFSTSKPSLSVSGQGYQHRSRIGLKPKRSRIAVATSFGAHFDVWLPVAQTAARVLGSYKDVNVYGPQYLGFMFEEIAQQLQIFPKETEREDALVPAMKRTDLFPDEPGAMIDVVVLGTCELDMDVFGEGLLEAWDARPADKKFKLVCVIHNFATQHWQHHISTWASRGAIRLLPLGEHVGTAYRRHFMREADEKHPAVFGSYLEHVDIDLHVPILDLPEYGSRRNARILSRAMIQGNFDKIRRDYDMAFDTLISSLKRNAKLWGYHPQSDTANPVAYEALSDGAEPFTLHLAGNGDLEIPLELQNIVFTHRNLDYSAFYNLTQSMDIIMPSFPNWDYCDNQASSTAVMATQCGVPLLTTKRIRQAYGYIDDDRVVVTRPQALREIEAIEVLRSQSLKSLPEMYAPSIHGSSFAMPDSFVRQVQEMLDQGFRRPQSGYAAFKQEMWQRNEETLWRILNDLPGEI